MFHKITSLATLPDYIILVGFSTGEYKQFDIKPLIKKYEPFKDLVNVPNLYEQARIDLGGYGIVWNDYIDLSAEGLFEQGIDCQPIVDIEKLKQKIIDEFVSARKNANISQKQLEILSGVAQPCIARTETGVSDPKLTTILKLLEPLGLTLSITNI